MKILVLAQVPPPVHGQSVMVKSLLECLRADTRFDVRHVNLGLSKEAVEVGRWRWGKIAATWRAAGEARRVLGEGRDTWLYYVPAPAKWGALLRDWVIMWRCRGRARGLILHWHASGMGKWQSRGLITRWLLGGAEMSVVLARELAEDAIALGPKDVAVVANGIDMTTVGRRTAQSDWCEVLFLGLCSRGKGVFDALEAVALANGRGEETGKRYRLTIAGSFADVTEEREVRARAATLGETARVVGFADAERKRELWAMADVFIFPTQYAHEAMPLTLIEAMAHGVSIVTTKWRAIPGMLPERGALCVEPGQVKALAAALGSVERGEAARAVLRAHYEKSFTGAVFTRAMTEVLLGLEKEHGP